MAVNDFLSYLTHTLIIAGYLGLRGAGFFFHEYLRISFGERYLLLPAVGEACVIRTQLTIPAPTAKQMASSRQACER